MHPDIYAARKGVPAIGYGYDCHFNQIMVHEGYEINMTSDMPDTDTFNLRLEFLDLDETEHSVTDYSSLKLCFFPRYKRTTGPYVLQSTNLSEQMAGTKRSYKDEDDYAPTAKRRIAREGRGGKNKSSGKLHLLPNPHHQHISVSIFDSSSQGSVLLSSYLLTILIATPWSRSVTRGADTGTRKPVIIDLSSDEEHSETMKSVTAIMKRLPPDSITGDFPRFHGAAVYIIIDPKSSVYQYRLHKATLSRVSPVFAKFLQMPCLEAMEELKIAATGAQARFELTYYSKYGKWVLRRAVS